MHFSPSLIALLSVVPFSLTAPTVRTDEAEAAPYPLPLPDGLPSLNPEQLQQIEKQAHGTLPGLPLPTNISAVGATNLQLIAFNQFIEVAFYTELLYNVTNTVKGYEFPNEVEKEFALRSLETILAQEKVHTLTANEALRHFGRPTIKPCVYSFPVTTLQDAIVLAATFTSHLIGTLQDITERFAANNDNAMTGLIAATIANKGAQSGWFRVFLDKYPSEVPTLTASDVNFGFTYAQSFVVPGSCPNINEIKLKTFSPLDIVTRPEPRTHKIKISWTHVHDDKKEELLWLAYVNQLNVPNVVPLQIVSCDGRKSVAVAIFPYEEFLLNGLTIAAVVNRQGPFANAVSVAQSAVYGPGLIVVE
ncbi:hypothetical protein BJY01DRAFT_257263 [Aspergillus pseudoustus]|uniref:Late sexual development protein n=1 Tax=Aspergillus pseudoustus TaxID=1810923 RepID=A0ABR4JLY6_9EURO